MKVQEIGNIRIFSSISLKKEAVVVSFASAVMSDSTTTLLPFIIIGKIFMILSQCNLMSWGITIFFIDFLMYSRKG